MSVFHTKYRPKNISELDSVAARETLIKFLNEPEEAPRAYLFVGPKGSGKTSAARILAKVVNCQSPVAGDACGKCQSCLEVEKHGAMDIIEIDAASNRGIDDVRSLKDRAYLAPTSLKYKVFVIDEVQMMTKEAFNALLKLIEEPPKHTFFVLCTTDPEKIPETVASRLVKVEFRRGTKEELVAAAQRVIKGEKIKMESGALELLVEVADGSFRNLHRALNELVLEKGSDIGEGEVKSFLSQRTGDYSPEAVAADMALGKLALVLEKLEKMALAQVDFVGFCSRLLDYFQGLLLAVASGEIKEGWEITNLSRWLRLLMEAIDRSKGISIGQLPLELAVVDFMTESESPKSQKVQKVEDEKEEEKVEEADERVEVKMEPKEIVEKWLDVLTAVRPYNHSIEAFLRATRPRELVGKKLTVEVFYPFHKEKLEEQRNRKIVEEVLKKVTGLDLEFSCVLAKNKIKPVVVDNGIETNKVVAGDDYEVAKQIFG